MATLNESPNSKAGKGRKKLNAPRVDLTAMVDLMFLLTTFFMLTTTLSRLNAADVVKPDLENPFAKADYPASRTMTILLTKNHQVVYYMGLGAEASMKMSTVANIREALLQNMKTVQATHPDARSKNMIVILKPTQTARFKDFVDVIDEMKIANVKTYAIDDHHQTEAEIRFLKSQSL